MRYRIIVGNVATKLLREIASALRPRNDDTNPPRRVSGIDDFGY
jgi:hypothetical protein